VRSEGLDVHGLVEGPAPGRRRRRHRGLPAPGGGGLPRRGARQPTQRVPGHRH
jgi:hypothetical protein